MSEGFRWPSDEDPQPPAPPAGAPASEPGGAEEAAIGEEEAAAAELPQRSFAREFLEEARMGASAKQDEMWARFRELTKGRRERRRREP